MTEENHLIKVDEFAAALRVKPSCVRRWILERRISTVKLGRLVRIPISEIERIVQSGFRSFHEPRRNELHNEARSNG
jgi:excisionase family DNA binding protein